MNKNNVFMKHFKRSLSVVMAVVVTITLAGCSSSDSDPIGDLNINEEYASFGNYKLTVGELYEELKHNSLGYLNQRIEETLFKDYLDGISATSAGGTDTQKELVAEYILKDIYATKDEDEIADISKKDRQVSIDKYIDIMMMEGYSVEFKNIVDDFQPLTVDDVTGSSAFSILWDEYRIEIAKYEYAYDVLAKEIADQNADAKDDDELENYFTDEEIATFYDANYSYDNNVEAVLIRFLNQEEANNTLRKFGIKAHNNEWYLIQPPVDNDIVDINGKWINESTYNKYYDEYSISLSNPGSSDTSIALSSMNDATVLKLFIEIYNYIYTYRTPLSYTEMGAVNSKVATDYTLTKSDYLYHYHLTLELIKSDRVDSVQDLTDLSSDLITLPDTTFTKEKLDTYSTSLTEYMNDTLSVTAKKDEDTNEDLPIIQYSATARSYNSNYYLVFKLADTASSDFYEITEDEDGNDVYDFKDATKKAEIENEMFLEELTDTFVSTRASERMDYITVEIYDSTLDYYYSQDNPDYTGTRGSSENLLALITFNDKKSEGVYKEGSKTTWDVEIGVVDSYKYLEKVYGENLSITLLFDKYIVDTTHYTDLADEYEDYKDAVYLTLTNFAADAYSSYGYPSTIGKYTFMKQYFRTAVVDEAIEYLMVQEARRQFFLEFPSDFYSQMGTFTSNAFDNFYSLTINNILVYVDRDEDGSPDTDWWGEDDDNHLTDPNDFLLSSTEKETLAKALIADLVKYVSHSTSALAPSFESVVAEFNTTTRIEPSSTDSTQNGTPESYWAKYRQHGIYLSTVALGDFTNTSDLEKEIQDLAKVLYNDSEVIYNDAFSGSYLLDGTTNYIATDEGYNLLLVTGGTSKTKIDMDNETDIYSKVPIKIDDSYKIFDLSSDSETKATAAQIEVYCREYFATGASTSLSSTATTYLDTYLNQFLTKYNSEIVQLMIMRNVLDGAKLSSTGAEIDIDDYVGYLQRLSDNYANTEVTGNPLNGFWAYIETIGGSN